MLELIVFCALVSAAAIFGGSIVAHFEQQRLQQMSDAVVECYALWDIDGSPMNIYAEEYDRREQAAKEQECNPQTATSRQ